MKKIAHSLKNCSHSQKHRNFLLKKIAKAEVIANYPEKRFQKSNTACQEVYDRREVVDKVDIRIATDFDGNRTIELCKLPKHRELLW